MSNVESCCIVAIDGPSGAGKGTISRLVAQNTGFHLLDSGAIYRLTALAALRAGVDLNDENACQTIADNLDIRFSIEGDSTLVWLQGDDVSQAIREEKVGMAASKVAAYPLVRAALLARQQQFAMAPGLVADGRDMGTVVFPQAPVKIFLTAAAEERAKRRVKQLEESNQEADYDKILADIQARDEQDSNRATAPLKPADDAVMLDSTQLSIMDVYERVMAEIASER